MSEVITNQLSVIREGRGITAAELARRTGVSRQTIYAIEAGSYVPNTVVSLRLARELEVPVEEIFRLPPPTSSHGPSQQSEVLSQEPFSTGAPVRICAVGSRRIAVPANASPYYLPDADGVLTKTVRGKRAELFEFSDAPSSTSGKRLAVAGCDPAIGFLAPQLVREGGVELVAAAASSRLALRWLKEGKVHVAGTHLRDPESGDFNLPYLRREFAGEDITVVTFAHWEEGFVTAPGNPKGIRTGEDLGKRNIRFVNREPGSGSRALADRLIKEAGLVATSIAGFDRLARGHLAAAYAVFTEEADCCIATRSAAQAFGLGFVPLEAERFDFVLHRRDLQNPSVRMLLDTLQRSSLRRKLERQAGYDTHHTGSMLM